MEQLTSEMQKQFDKMQAHGRLYRSNITGDAIWKIYLALFTEEQDPVFRDPNSSTYNCKLCNSFIRRYGNIVAIDEHNNIMSLFDFIPSNSKYKESLYNMSTMLHHGKIKDVFFETFDMLKSLPYETCKKTQKSFRLGTNRNHKRYTAAEAEMYKRGDVYIVTPNEVRTFNHLYLNLDSKYVDMGSSSIEQIMSRHRDAKTVFKRCLDDISVDTLTLVRDLINQGSLLNGEAHLKKVEAMLAYAVAYKDVQRDHQDNWCWTNSRDNKNAKFKNELIGVLCTDLAEGMEINKACKTWNKRVDPANYMKAVAPITEAQKKRAQTFVEENGYVESFARRFAVLDDISANEIKHINVGDGKIKSVSMFDNVKPTSTRHKKNEFEGVEEVSIEKFMSDILPGCTSVEAYLENRHSGNLVTMTTAEVTDSKPIFKWNNNFSWTYNGNLAGKSQLSQEVVNRGGKVDGVFRFSQSWNELERNQSLMDLHVFMPGNTHMENPNGKREYGSGRRVGWNNRRDGKSKGQQDVDYTSEAPVGHVPVENITFPELSLMPEGKYICKIHNWAFRKTGGRGKAEIAFGDEVYEYVYPATKNYEWVTVAEVTLKNGHFSIEHKLPTESSEKEVYGLKTNNFHKVNLVSLSPNHWGTNEAGNKHFFFMLDGCATDASLRSFHSENLIASVAEHRKVLEVLGAVNMIEPTTAKQNKNNPQLSGLGFNATVKDEVIVKVKGSFKRTLKIKF